jgi:hypothetical protein
MIDGKEPVCILLEEDMAAFPVGVVAKDIEKGDRLEELLVLFCEIEIVIFGIVIDQLLEGTSPIGTIIPQRGERNDVKAKMFADEIRSNFPACKTVFGKIPKGLLAAHGFVNGMILLAAMMDYDKKRVIRAKGELARNLIIAVL